MLLRSTRCPRHGRPRRPRRPLTRDLPRAGGHFLAWLADNRGHDDALHSRTGRDRAIDAYLTAAVEERGVVGRTVDLTLTALTVFYQWLGLGAPATPRVVVEPINPRTLGPSEQRALLRAAAARGPRAVAILVLALDAGPRKSRLPPSR
ncbi:hypothetical protein [Nocardia gipuzkoensis]